MNIYINKIQYLHEVGRREVGSVSLRGGSVSLCGGSLLCGCSLQAGEDRTRLRACYAAAEMSIV